MQLSNFIEFITRPASGSFDEVQYWKAHLFFSKAVSLPHKTDCMTDLNFEIIFASISRWVDNLNTQYLSLQYSLHVPMDTACLFISQFFVDLPPSSLIYNTHGFF